MKTTIKDIKAKLQALEFTNEAEVTIGVVLRVLYELGWPIYNPRIVKPQYRTDNNKIIDFALCHPDDKPVIIVEVKKVGNSNGSDDQVLEYAFRTGVPIAILTDGQEWYFYLPSGRGSLSERKFYKLDFLARDENDIEQVLNRYLKFDNVKSNSAIKNAKEDYEQMINLNEARTSVPEAWKALLKDKDEMLSMVVAEKVEDLCGHKPNNRIIFEFFEQLTNQNTLPTNSYQNSKESQGVKLVKDIVPAVTNRGFAIIINDVVIPQKGIKSICFELLKIAIDLCPNRIEELVRINSTNSRSLFSTDIRQLYRNQDHSWSVQNSERLIGDWWFGHNYNKDSFKKYCINTKNFINKYSNQKVDFIC